MLVVDQDYYSVHCVAAGRPARAEVGVSIRTVEMLRVFLRSRDFGLFRGSQLRLVSTRTLASLQQSAKVSILQDCCASYPETFCMLAPAQASPGRWVVRHVRAQRGGLT